MGGVVDAIGCAAGSVASSIGNAVGSVANTAGNVIQGALNNPIGTLGTIGAVALGQPELIPLINGASTLANGGNLGQALTSAGTGYIAGAIGNSVSGAVGSALSPSLGSGLSLPSGIDVSSPYSLGSGASSGLLDNAGSGLSASSLASSIDPYSLGSGAIGAYAGNAGSGLSIPSAFNSQCIYSLASTSAPFTDKIASAAGNAAGKLTGSLLNSTSNSPVNSIGSQSNKNASNSNGLGNDTSLIRYNSPINKNINALQPIAQPQLKLTPTPININFCGSNSLQDIKSQLNSQLNENGIQDPIDLKINGFASGGLSRKYEDEKPDGHHPEFITGITGHYACGKGTGQSDDIPAMLHDGDYVMDADTVSALGDGSSKAGKHVLDGFMHEIPHNNKIGDHPIAAKIADGEYVFPASFVTALGKGDNKKGAKILDGLREKLRSHKRNAPVNKIPPKAKSPLDYIKKG